MIELFVSPNRTSDIQMTCDSLKVLGMSRCSGNSPGGKRPGLRATIIVSCSMLQQRILMKTARKLDGRHRMRLLAFFRWLKLRFRRGMSVLWTFLDLALATCPSGAL